MRLVFVLLLLLVATAAQAERRVALVLANDDYKIVRPLKNAVNDSRTIEATLEKLGFEVTSESNRDLRRMRRALEDFEEDAAGADVALIFFSGHGVEIAGDNRLLPTDADPSSLEQLKKTTLPLEDVRDTVTKVARIGLVVLDACRNDPFGQSDAGGDGRGVVSIAPEVKAAVTPGLGRVGRAENVLFSFSAAPGKTASDGANGNSEFSTALAKFLPTDGLEIRSVLTLVQQDVYDQSRGRQLPYVESGLPKLFFAASDGGQLPERDRLLLAMADVTPDLRAEVETIAAKSDMPLAPLYAALITSEGKAMQPVQRQRKLQEAADAFIKVRADLRNLASSDPQVTELRRKADAQLALGSFDEARALLQQAVAIDGKSRDALKDRFIERTLSEATTLYLAGGASQAQLRYDLAIADYQKAAALYDEIEGFDLSDADRQQHMYIFELIGTLQRTVGNLPGAGEVFRRLEAVAQRQSEKKPADLDLQRTYAITKGFVADVLYDQGDLDGALAKYGEAQKILLSLLSHTEDKHWVQWMRDLAVNLNRVGDIARIGGDYQGALKAYKYALQMTEELVKELPDELLLRFDMAVCYGKIGSAQRLANDLEGALASFDLAVQIDDSLVARQPDNAGYLRDTTVNLNWIGNIKRLMGKPKEALEPFRRSHEITQKLVARDPGNTLYRADLSASFANIGNVRADSGDMDGALDAYRSALAIAEYLADLDPSNADQQRNLSVAHNRVGDALFGKGDTAGAAAEYQAGYTVARALWEANQTDTQRILDLIYSRYKLGVAGIDVQKNLTAAHKALTGMKDAGTLPPANEVWITMVKNAMTHAGIE